MPSAARLSFSLPTPSASTTAFRGDRGCVLTVGLRDAERRGDLLQEDDHGNADGEPFDHWPRDVHEVAAHARERSDEDKHARDEADHEDSVGSEPSHDGDEHDGHRAVGPDTCTFEPPKTAATNPGDDGRDEARLRAEARGDPKGERQWERHHAHRETGDKIVAERSRKPHVVNRVAGARPSPTRGQVESSQASH